MSTGTHTEGTMVEETPEPGVGHLESLDGVSRTGYDLFHYTTEDIGDNLEEKLTDEHCLGTEILVYDRSQQ